MGLFGFGRPQGGSIDINEAAERIKTEEGAVLLDVRNPDEYKAGHVPGSVNLPLSYISDVDLEVPDFDAPVYVYCLTGARSSRAVQYMKGIGYTNVRNVGGIIKWRGEME